jgi:type VI secretion system protein ImpI
MSLTLAIENVANLPDGGPINIAITGKRGIDIGRDEHLDWTLPDPDRFISGKHCEIRYEAGAYVLTDVSSNGTFLNDAPNRMSAPHRLHNGDRVLIGRYIISVLVEADEAAQEEPASAFVRVFPADLWDTEEPAPAPIDPRELKPVPDRPKSPDFLDWAMDVFDPLSDQLRKPDGPRRAEDQSWLPPPASDPPPQPAPSAPAPRRPIWDSETLESAAVPSETSPLPPPPAPSPIASTPIAPEPWAENTTGQSGALFVRRFAEAAGLPPEAIAVQDPEELAALLGGLIKIVAEDVKQLLHARLEAKRLARSANQTTIQTADNNPLKYSPTSRDALRLMFGPPTRSYLGAADALRQSFDDLKRHQIDTLAATQGAVKMLVDDLSPREIEASVEPDRGFLAVLASRKAKLWDAYVARWQAKAHNHDDGLIGAFMFYFPQCYDRNSKS